MSLVVFLLNALIVSGLAYERSPGVIRLLEDEPNVHNHDPRVHQGITRLTRRRMPENFDNSSNQIPVDFIKYLNDYEANDILANFVEYDEQDTSFISNRFGESEERSSAVMPKEAGCKPEMQTVELASSKDPSILYIPQCTRVERCGGCCRHKLLACQPVPSKVEILNYQVYKTQYANGRQKFKLIEKVVVPVERHLKCECSCRIKEKDCAPIQEYRENECRCVCRNTEEKKKCEKRHGVTFWNPDLCMCQCRNVTQCSTGYLFDHSECKCVSKALRRRFITFETYYDA